MIRLNIERRNIILRLKYYIRNIKTISISEKIIFSVIRLSMNSYLRDRSNDLLSIKLVYPGIEFTFSQSQWILGYSVITARRVVSLRSYQLTFSWEMNVNSELERGWFWSASYFSLSRSRKLCHLVTKVLVILIVIYYCFLRSSTWSFTLFIVRVRIFSFFYVNVSCIYSKVYSSCVGIVYPERVQSFLRLRENYVHKCRF